MIVIADATPLNYLILIDQVDLLSQLFDRILIPPAVFEELHHQEHRMLSGAGSPVLPRGSRCKRCVPFSTRRWASLMQENEKRSPSQRSFRPISFCWMMPTLAVKPLGAICPSSGVGVWREAARRELVDLRVVLVQLQETSFFVDPGLIEALLEEEARRKRGHEERLWNL